MEDFKNSSISLIHDLCYASKRVDFLNLYYDLNFKDKDFDTNEIQKDLQFIDKLGYEEKIKIPDKYGFVCPWQRTDQMKDFDREAIFLTNKFKNAKSEEDFFSFYRELIDENIVFEKVGRKTIYQNDSIIFEKVEYDLDEINKDFSSFNNISYNDKIKLLEKYGISSLFIFVIPNSGIYECDFETVPQYKAFDILEILRCLRWNIYHFFPTQKIMKNELSPFYEENEEELLLEFTVSKDSKSNYGLEELQEKYKKRISIHRFPEEYLESEIRVIKNEIENETVEDIEVEKAKQLGIKYYKIGLNFPFANYTFLLERYLLINLNFSFLFGYGSFFYGLFEGFKITHYYKFLLEQQKRLQRGEDITKFENSVGNESSLIGLFGFKMIDAYKVQLEQQTRLQRAEDITKFEKESEKTINRPKLDETVVFKLLKYHFEYNVTFFDFDNQKEYRNHLISELKINKESFKNPFSRFRKIIYDEGKTMTYDGIDFAIKELDVLKDKFKNNTSILEKIDQHIIKLTNKQKNK